MNRGGPTKEKYHPTPSVLNSHKLYQIIYNFLPALK